MRKFLSFVTLCLVCGLPARADGPPSVKPQKKVVASLDVGRVVDRVVRPYVGYLTPPPPEFVGLAIGVIKGDDRSRHFYGETLKGNHTPPAADTLFAIGSVTKTMTATLLALYDRRGLVHIPPPGGSLASETKLQDLLPSGCVLPARRKTITLEQLADHHAGLPRKPDAKIDNGTYALDLDALYKDVCTCPIACPPGGGECPCASPPCACKPPVPSSGAGEYSNFGYAVLGDVLAPLHAPGATWAQANRQELMLPMGMSSTGVKSELTDPSCLAGSCAYADYGDCSYKPQCHGTFSPRAAIGYRQDGITPHPEQGFNTPVTEAAGQLWSTIDDMLIWLGWNMGQEGSPFLHELTALLAALHTPRAGNTGLAWNQVTLSGTTTVAIEKPGSAPGFRAYIGFVPSRSIGVVVLANCDVEAETIGRQILSQL